VLSDRKQTKYTVNREKGAVPQTDFLKTNFMFGVEQLSTKKQ